MKKYGKTQKLMDCIYCDGDGTTFECSCDSWHHDDTYYCMTNDCLRGGKQVEKKCKYCDGTGQVLQEIDIDQLIEDY